VVLTAAAPVVQHVLLHAASQHPDLLATVLGELGEPVPAWTESATGRREGWVRAAGQDALARLRFYAASIGLSARKVGVTTESGVVAAVTFPGLPAVAPDAPAGLAVEIVREIMACYGHLSARQTCARLGPLAVRAASRLRASGEDAPATLRRQPGQVTVHKARLSYANFFAVEESDLSFERFDGAPSPVVTRAAFVSGDAVTVLPYDPARDRVLLVEQFRTGPLARGDRNPWQLEAIAGRIDAGETPEQAARREAVEEAGLSLGALLSVGSYYPSPGAKTEFIYSYVALTDLPDDAAGVFGVASEAEDIRGHLVGFDRCMGLVASGEIQNAPLLLSLMWLDRERKRLRDLGRK
jgi:ADP-ribose pyrophosphatase